MHEAGIVASMLELAEAQARRAGARVIHRVRLRVGAMSGVVPEALEFAFAALQGGTLAADARLEIEAVPATAFCGACQRAFEPDDAVFACPQCGEFSAELRQGRELELVNLEIS